MSYLYGEYPMENNDLYMTLNQSPPRSMPISMVSVTSSPSYSKILQNRQLVDKTSQYASLLTGDQKLLIIRPPKMGKTTLLGGIKHICEGKEVKYLYRNLQICKQYWTDINGCFVDANGISHGKFATGENAPDFVPSYATQYTWKKYPVIYINFKAISLGSYINWNSSLIRQLEYTTKEHGLHNQLSEYKRDKSGVEYFDELLLQLSFLGRGYESKPVILIDDYESLLQNCNSGYNGNKTEAILFVNQFYSKLKSFDKRIQLLVITGSSSIEMNGVLSRLSIWNDVSLDKFYNTLIGFTDEEICRKFTNNLFEKVYNNLPSTEKFTLRLNKNKERKNIVTHNIWSHCGGYIFAGGEYIPAVYNSDLIMKCFANLNIKSNGPEYYRSELQTFTHGELQDIIELVYYKDLPSFISEDILKGERQYIYGKEFENDKYKTETYISKLYQAGVYTICHQHTVDEVEDEIERRIITKIGKEINGLEINIAKLHCKECKTIHEENKPSLQIYLGKIISCKAQISKIEDDENEDGMERNLSGLKLGSAYYSLKFLSKEVNEDVKEAIIQLCRGFDEVMILMIQAILTILN